ncbi:hypothetical protein PCANC_07582 [Puccinia coronata f. sp. avenae]|uniref:DNA repair protein RAD16 n=1 Tax=Puccinia coronata f. sp. avenae TaxID=200324 RepID=A0A2N5VKF5_9BASI|nr:hypothetical protein PCANC_07582 [Puccinia coronata f. sp. avenae]
MAKPNSQPVAHRRSARLSNCLAKTPTTKRDLDPEFTDPSSVESSGPKAGPSNHKRKRAADDDAPTAASKPSRKARRGHSFPSKVSKPEDVPRVSKRTKSLSSRYFQADPSETNNKHKGAQSSKHASRLESSEESDSQAVRKTQPKAKGKGRQFEIESSPSENNSDEHAILSQIQLANNSTSKGKGKARQIELSSEEEGSSEDEIALSNTRPPTRKSATTLSKRVQRDDDSELEAEMIKAAIELSKKEYRPTGPHATSVSGTQRTSLAKKATSLSRKTRAMIVEDEDDSGGSEFQFDHESSSALSSFDSESDHSFENEHDDDGHSALPKKPSQDAPSASRKKAPRARRTVIKIPKNLTWWEKNQIKLETHHPELKDVWGDLTQKVKVVEVCKAEQPDGLDLTLLPFQLEGLYWMKKQEAGPWSGGVLADEMGMGKTIQTIALILSDRVPGHRKQTLVIAPTVAIMQWRNEIEKFAKGVTVNVWHGGNRSIAQKEMEGFDVVLTSFAVLESNFRRQHSGFRRKGQLIKEPSLLHKIKWHRVILDEAHNIKDRSCNTAKGAFELKATYRWCLSGTPLQNRVGELYSLIRFLGADPFSYYFCKQCDCKSLHWKFSDRRTCDQCKHSPMQHVCFWNNEILKPVQKYGASVVGSHGHTAFNKLKVLLDRMMLRRTKLERADDLGLPPRAVLVRRDYFTEEEEELYSSLYSDVTRKFSTYADAGTVLNNYGNIFQLITRMRQMSNHPDLVLKSRAAQAAFKTITDSDAPNADINELTSIQTCRICLDEAEDAIISRCRHIFCRECIRQYLETATEQEPECPVCHLPITIDLSQDALQDESSSKARQGVLDRLDPGKWRTSTKIEALVEELSKLNHSDHSIKSIVFSQFTVFLDLIERRLQLAGFKLARLQGNMTPEARNRTIQYFMNNNDVQVFLVSLKAGGVALNLTEASRVFIMDPWWNPAVELQAMDRIHRLGQHRPVVITRLIIENSIESRIVELQKKKEAMTGAALGDDDQALGRLTPEDLSFLFTL